MEDRHTVTIAWGSDSTRQEADTESTYYFDTEKELIAFMEGVEASIGWMDYEVVEEDEDVLTRVRKTGLLFPEGEDDG